MNREAITSDSDRQMSKDRQPVRLRRSVVLIAVANAIEYRLISAMLWLEGLEGVPVACASEAREIARGYSIVGLIVDIDDDIIDWQTLAEQLRDQEEEFSNLPVVGLSNGAWSGFGELWRAAGITMLLKRPYTSGDLCWALGQRAKQI